MIIRRSERDIKRAWMDHGPFEPATHISEFRIHPCRADLITITDDDVYAVEIKSDLDKVTRLTKQLATYQTVFDKVVVCAGPRIGADMHLSDHVGLVIVDDGHFTVHREPTSYTQRLDVHAMVNSLRRKENLHLCSAMGSPINPNTPNTKITTQIHHALDSYNPVDVLVEYKNILRRR